jgi:CheY-like chemotaxis protein
MRVSSARGASEPEARGYVLVVDDDDDIRGAIEEILQGEGYVAVGARNGAEALELLRKDVGLPQLVLLDLMMPEMDGWEFLARIDGDARLHRIPVALMSAHESVRKAFDKHREEARSMRLLFPKPLNLLRLISTVRHFTDGSSVEDEWTTEDALSEHEAPTARFHPLR